VGPTGTASTISFHKGILGKPNRRLQDNNNNNHFMPKPFGREKIKEQ
jgi:hypothetical protein